LVWSIIYFNLSN